MSALWWGKGPTIPVEQPTEFEVTADGVLTVTRRWRAGIAALAGRQSKVRDPMPPMLFINNTNPYPFVTCLCVSSRIYHDKSEIYWLEEVYQGTYALPFAIFQWQTQRLDRPIPLHPRFDGTFNGQPVMTANVNWASNPLNPGIWDGFPVFNIASIAQDTQNGNYIYTPLDGITPTASNPNHASPKTFNPYRGIESYPVSTGTWRRTTFTTDPAITGNMWYLDPPGFDDTVPDALLASLPDSDNTGNHWIKSQEDIQNLYRGASELWQMDESWWYNSLGWLPEIFTPGGNT
jgi:hypothetical protein